MNKLLLFSIISTIILTISAIFLFVSQSDDKGGKIIDDIKFESPQDEDDNVADIEKETEDPDEGVDSDDTGLATEGAPYPSPENMISVFFRALDENDVPEAMKVMHPDAITDDSVKQSYGVQFNEVESAKLISADKYDESSWAPDTRKFKVTADVEMSKDSLNAPIPYYGWDGSPDVKWFTMKKDGNIWKIKEISSGP